jgi:hypothetical protein
MKGIIFTTKEELDLANHNEAIKRGCEGTTLFWFSTAELTDGTFALITDENIIVTDEEGNETVYESVDISDLLPAVNEE